jgi:hypothetical protein
MCIINISTYPKIFHFESRNLPMAGAYLVYVFKEVVEVVETFDTLVEGVHHVVGVFRQLHRVGLLLFRLALAELVEHVQKVLVLFK